MGKAPIETMVGREVHGRVDNVVYRQLHGEAVLARRPRLPFKVPPSDEQLRVQGAFRQAAGHAYHVFHDADKAALKAEYAAAAERRGVPPDRLFPFIVRDKAKPPVIGKIDDTLYHRHVGDEIHIVATDDCKVTGVTVKITKQDDGTLIEQGPARDDGGFWRYVATAEAPAAVPLVLEVTATDLAENRTIERMGIMT